MLVSVIQIVTPLSAASPSTVILKEELANSAIARASLDVSALLSTGEGRDQSLGHPLLCTALTMHLYSAGKVWSVLLHLGPKNSMEVPNIIHVFLYV